MEMVNKSIDQQAQQIIREVLDQSGQKALDIILFGSRARLTAREDSDWDYLVIVPLPISFVQKQAMIRQIKRKLARRFIPNDIIIQSLEEFEEKKKIPGTISRNITLEGLRG